MKRTILFTCGMDISLTLEIDTDVLSQETATEVSAFWASHEEVAEIAKGDVYVATGLYAASKLAWLLMDGYNPNGAMEELTSDEGWPPRDQLGIRLVSFEIPDMRAADFEWNEVPSKAA